MVISRVICPHTDGMSHSLFEITKPAQSLLFGFRIIQLQTTENFLAGRDDFNIQRTVSERFQRTVSVRGLFI